MFQLPQPLFSQMVRCVRCLIERRHADGRSDSSPLETVHGETEDAKDVEVDVRAGVFFWHNGVEKAQGYREMVCYALDNRTSQRNHAKDVM